MSSWTLASIYETLAAECVSESRPQDAPAIARYQYDRFCELWKLSAERRGIIHACQAIAANPALNCHNAWARSFGHPSTPHPSAPSAKQALRATALADALAEIVWIFVSRFDVWPLLYGLDGVEPVTSRPLSTNGGPERRWVKLLVSTYAIFHFPARRADGKIDVDWKSQERTGWIEELRCVEYVKGEDAMPVTAANWRGLVERAYSDVASRFKLEGYFGNLSYFTGHNAEIAVGYHRKDDADAWHPVAINDQALSETRDVDSVLKTLGLHSEGAAGLHAAVKHNLFHFQPEFLRCLIEEIEQGAAAPDQGVDAANAGATTRAGFNQSGDSLSAVAMTYNLGSLTDANDSTTREPAAAAFATLIFSTPKRTQDLLLQGRNDLSWPEFERTRLGRVVSSLWEAVDSLKLPVSHVMVKEQIQAYAHLTRASEGYASLYNDISRPLASLLSLTNKLSLTATELSMLRGDHLAALHAVRHRLAMRFEAGWADGSNSRVSGNHELERFSTVEQIAAMMLSVVQTIAGEEESSSNVPMSAWPMLLLRRLQAARAATPDKQAIFSILSWRNAWCGGSVTSRDAARIALEGLENEWHELIKGKTLRHKGDTPYTTDPQLKFTTFAFNAVKRRTHTLFKPSVIATAVSPDGDARFDADKTAALDDLAVFLPSGLQVSSSPDLSAIGLHECNYGLFHPRSFPFRSIGDFFGVLSSLCQHRDISRGSLKFQDMANEAGGRTKRTEILVHSSSETQRILRKENLGQLRSAIEALTPQALGGRSTGMHAFEGVILGDFFTPLMAVLRNVLPRFSMTIEEPDEALPSITFVFCLRRESNAKGQASAEPPLFRWQIGEHSIRFESFQSPSSHSGAS